MSKIDFLPFEDDGFKEQTAWWKGKKALLGGLVIMLTLVLAIIGLSIALGISESRSSSTTTTNGNGGVTSTETSVVSAVGIFEIVVTPSSHLGLQDAEPGENSNEFQITVNKTACSTKDLEGIRATQKIDGDTLILSFDVQPTKNYCGDPVRLLIKKPKHVSLRSIVPAETGLSLSLAGIPNPQVTLLLSVEQDNGTYVKTQVSLMMFHGHRDVREFFQCRMVNLGPFVSCQTANPLLQQHDALAIVFYYDLINQALSVILSIGYTSIEANQTLDDYVRAGNQTENTDIKVRAGFFDVTEKAVFKAFGDGYFELFASHTPEYEPSANLTYLLGDLKLGKRSGWESVLATNLDVHSRFELGLLSDNLPFAKIRILSANGEVFEFNSLKRNIFNEIEYLPQGAVTERRALLAAPRADPTMPAPEQRRGTTTIYHENGLSISEGGTTEALVYTLAITQENVNAEILISFDQSAGLYQYNSETHLPVAVKLRVVDKKSGHTALELPFVTHSFVPTVKGFGGTLHVNATPILQLVLDAQVFLLQQTPAGDWVSFLGEATIPDLSWSIPIFSALAGHLNETGVLPTASCMSKPTCIVQWHLRLAGKALHRFVTAPKLRMKRINRASRFLTFAQADCCNQCCAAFDDDANDATKGGASLIGGVLCGGLRIPFTKVYLVHGCLHEPYMHNVDCSHVGNCA